MSLKITRAVAAALATMGECATPLNTLAPWVLW